MNWAYLAGFTDGDGCIGVEHRQKAKETYIWARLRWSQKASNRLVLDTIREFLVQQGMKVTGRNMTVEYKGHKYPQMDLAITNAEDTRCALTQMLPYLIVKRERAEQALDMLNRVAAAKAQYGWKYRCHMEWPEVAAEDSP